MPPAGEISSAGGYFIVNKSLGYRGGFFRFFSNVSR